VWAPLVGPEASGRLESWAHSSSSWLVPTLGALIGAVGSLVAAYVSSARHSKDLRAQILQDLVIAEKLPENSQAKPLLKTYAENRAVLLPIENHLRQIKVRELAGVLLLLIVMVLNFVTARTGTSYWLLLLAVAAVLVIPALSWNIYAHRRRNLVQQFLSEHDIPSTVLEPVNDLIVRSQRPWWRRKSKMD